MLVWHWLVNREDLVFFKAFVLIDSMNFNDLGADNKIGLKIVSSKECWHDTWLSVKQSAFLDRDGEPQTWSYVERQMNRRAVVIIARTKNKEDLIAIKQFRIPVASWVYEFPAGLVDANESLQEAAIRELAEETGYEGTVAKLGPMVLTSPGMTTERFSLVEMNAEEVPSAHAQEAAEAIELVLIKKGSEKEFIAQAERDNIELDSKLYVYLATISS